MLPRSLWCFWLIGALLFCGSSVLAQRPTEDNSKLEVELARQKVYPALVNISVVARFFNGGRTQRAPAGGSGVIVNKEGYILTNYHVAGNTTRIVCTLITGEAIEAKVVLHDPLTDLSVLKLLIEKRDDPTIPLPHANLGDSDVVQVGDTVMSMGNPLLLSSSMTLGIVSNTKRVFTDFTGTQIQEQELDEGEKTGVFTRWIQHDALILPGNSGGPLVNTKAEVIGINELGGGGIGFAIPSNIAAKVLKSAIEKGSIIRGWIGVSVLPVSKMGRTTGSLVASVVPKSPADAAGIEAGDVLLEMEGKPVTTRFFEEIPLFYQQVANLTVGSTVSMKLLRKSVERTVTVTVALMEKTLGAEEEVRQIGATLQVITDAMARARRLADKQGVMVTGVRSGFPLEGAKPAITQGDVILSIGDKKVNSLADVRAALANVKHDDFVIIIRRRREELVSVAKIPEEAPPAEGTELPKAWLGVRTQVMTAEVSKGLKMPGVRGLRVTEIYPSTAVAKAGLLVGDILTRLNNEPINSFRPQDAEDLRRLIEDLPIGKKATLSVLRGGKTVGISFIAEAQALGGDLAKSAKQKEFEFAVRDLMPLDRIERRLKPSTKGVVVTEAVIGGWAQIAGLELDDIIHSINGQLIESVEGFEQVMKAAMQEHPKIIQIFVERGSRTHFIFIEPDWNKIVENR